MVELEGLLLKDIGDGAVFGVDEGFGLDVAVGGDGVALAMEVRMLGFSAIEFLYKWSWT